MFFFFFCFRRTFLRSSTEYEVTRSTCAGTGLSTEKLGKQSRIFTKILQKMECIGNMKKMDGFGKLSWHLCIKKKWNVKSQSCHYRKLNLLQSQGSLPREIWRNLRFDFRHKWELENNKVYSGPVEPNLICAFSSVKTMVSQSRNLTGWSPWWVH